MDQEWGGGQRQRAWPWTRAHVEVEAVVLLDILLHVAKDELNPDSDNKDNNEINVVGKLRATHTETL